jgi:glucoside 3-dehydrogenase (cytochrome c) hitch-hiker subunit
MKRRDLLRAAGAATALSIVPRHAGAAWARVRAGYQSASGLTPAQKALVATMGDTILPRTDTPSATDVGVTEWVDLIATEYYSAEERAEFTTGLDAIDTQVRALHGRAFADLDVAAQQEVVASFEPPDDEGSQAQRAYARLKRLVVHGYFTSEPVQQDVLHTRTFFDRFQGAADMPARRQ